MRLALSFAAAIGLSASAFAQTAPVAVPKNDQFGTLVQACELSKKCIGGDRKSCEVMDAHLCAGFIEGVAIPMRMACNSRKTNTNFPKAMAMKEAKTVDKIDVLVKFAKANPGELVKHRGPVTVRAFAQELPCEN